MAWKTATASAAATMALAVWPLGLRPDETVSFDVLPPIAHGGLFDQWVVLPDPALRRVSDAQRMVTELKQMTGWSDRRFAHVLRSSHPTVSSVAHGRSNARSGDLYERIAEAFEVADRIFLVAGRNPAETDRLLSSEAADGPSAVELLRDRDPSGAYLAALDVHRPARRSGFMRGARPAAAGSATSEVTID